MTPQRRQRLEELMTEIIDREIAELVRKHAADKVTAHQVSERISALSEIAACIGTAYQALHLGEDL